MLQCYPILMHTHYVLVASELLQATADCRLGIWSRHYEILSHMFINNAAS